MGEIYGEIHPSISICSGSSGSQQRDSSMLRVGQWGTVPSADTIKESHAHCTPLHCCPSLSLARFTFFVHVAIIPISLVSCPHATMERRKIIDCHIAHTALPSRPWHALYQDMAWPHLVGFAVLDLSAPLVLISSLLYK